MKKIDWHIFEQEVNNWNSVDLIELCKRNDFEELMDGRKGNGFLLLPKKGPHLLKSKIGVRLISGTTRLNT
jgi:hypothetical protein